MNAVKNAVLSALRKKQRQLAEIDKLLQTNAISEIISLRIKAQKIFDENKNNHEEISRLIKPLSIEERRLKDVANRQSNPKLFEKKCNLTIEISDLKSELSRLDFYGIRRK